MAKRKIILVTGSHGLVGSSFVSNIFNYDTQVMGEKIESRKTTLICPEHTRMDISQKSEVKRYIENYKPDVVINFAAHRNANTAEEQRGNKNGSAWKSNVDGVNNLSILTKQHGIYLMHISTDMVFSGYKENKGPYSELNEPESDPAHLSWYGWTKKVGEELVIGVKDAAIIRIANVTRPVYDPRLDYVGKILWLYDNNKLYPMFDDQYSTLTYIPHITDTILALLERRLSGVFHVASTNMFTPYKLSSYLFNEMKLKNITISGKSVSGYLKEMPNRYPQYGGLNSSLTQSKLRLKYSTWEEIVNKFVRYVNNLRL